MVACFDDDRQVGLAVRSDYPHVEGDGEQDRLAGEHERGVRPKYER